MDEHILEAIPEQHHQAVKNLRRRFPNHRIVLPCDLRPGDWCVARYSKDGVEVLVLADDRPRRARIGTRA